MHLGHYLALSCTLFGIGAVGFVMRRNILVQMMCIEVMLNAVNLLFVAFNRWHIGSLDGQLFAFLTIAVAAAEAAVGLAIVIALFRLRQTVQSDALSTLKR